MFDVSQKRIEKEREREERRKSTNEWCFPSLSSFRSFTFLPTYIISRIEVHFTHTCTFSRLIFDISLCQLPRNPWKASKPSQLKWNWRSSKLYFLPWNRNLVHRRSKSSWKRSITFGNSKSNCSIDSRRMLQVRRNRRSCHFPFTDDRLALDQSPVSELSPVSTDTSLSSIPFQDIGNCSDWSVFYLSIFYLFHVNIYGGHRFSQYIGMNDVDRSTTCSRSFYLMSK